MGKTTILVIDDEKDLLELVRYNLEKEHLAVITASNGKDGLEIVRQHHPDLAILDLMMPGMNGMEVCRQLRSEPLSADLPIIMLTARADEADRVVGLEAGADDYVTKPFSPRELLARVRAVLRRAKKSGQVERVVRSGELKINVPTHEVSYGGTSINLTATEFRILEFLASRPGRVMSRDQIIDAALGRDAAVVDRTIDVHMNALRKKLGEGGEQIETVRGFGYKFRQENEE